MATFDQNLLFRQILSKNIALWANYQRKSDVHLDNNLGVSARPTLGFS